MLAFVKKNEKKLNLFIKKRFCNFICVKKVFIEFKPISKVICVNTKNYSNITIKFRPTVKTVLGFF